MRCINKHYVFRLFIFCILPAVLLSGCGRSFVFPYSDNRSDVSFRLMQKTAGNSEIVEPFAADLCVSSDDVYGDARIETGASAAAVFDVSRMRTIYADRIYEKVYPASLTKIMTAIIALKTTSPDTMLTASSNIYNLEAGAQTCGLEAGDTMSLDQALRLLLVCSANDVAIMIAENIGGSTEGFISMMNSEARRLGATGTNFINSNGLSDSNHYTTVYDMYLIFNEALHYELFNEIINMTSYSTIYRNASGTEKNVSVNTTNLYLRGERTAPAGVMVIGGKTGTTQAAGHCLALLTRDVTGNPYISIVMGCSTTDGLYASMNALLDRIPK